MHGLDHDFAALHSEMREEEEREESVEADHKMKEEVQNTEKDVGKVEEKHAIVEVHEAERTKKKRKKLKESDIMKTDILERTPKMEKTFTFINLHPHCISPLVFSSHKKEDREEKMFNPCILHLNDHPMVSPSKLLNLNSPMPQYYQDHRAPPITKRLFFGDF